MSRSRATRTQTVNVTDVRKAAQKIGDRLNDTYEDSGDLKAAQGAIQAYGVALKAASAHLIYKKLTAAPERIAFFETP